METQEPNTQPTQNSNSEAETYQSKLNYNQARINYELNEVDKDIINTLNLIVLALKKIKALPGLTREMNSLDFSPIEKVLSDAGARSKTVASIKPPGCEPPPYPTPE